MCKIRCFFTEKRNGETITGAPGAPPSTQVVNGVGVVFVNVYRIHVHAIMCILLSIFTAETLGRCEWASKETPDIKLQTIKIYPAKPCLPHPFEL